MRILIVTATSAEIAPLASSLAARRDVDTLVTGIGMVATATRAARALAQKPYDFALNLGLCGSFDRTIPVGSVVHVVSDCLPELGAEDGDAFLPIESLNLPSDHHVRNDRPPRNAALGGLPSVSGITVNTVHGNDRSIAAVVARCRPQVESMEGAAFMCACRLSGVVYAQVRAVSNVVERRNRDSWKIKDAIDALAGAAQRILEHA